MFDEKYRFYDEKNGEYTEMTASEWKEVIENTLAPVRKKTKILQIVCHSVFCTMIVACIVSGIASYVTRGDLESNVFGYCFMMFLGSIALWFGMVEYLRHRVITIEKIRKAMWGKIDCNNYGKYYDDNKW